MGYTDARLDSMLIIEAFIGQMTDTFLLFHFIKLCKVDFFNSCVMMTSPTWEVQSPSGNRWIQGELEILCFNPKYPHSGNSRPPPTLCIWSFLNLRTFRFSKEIFYTLKGSSGALKFCLSNDWIRIGFFFLFGNVCRHINHLVLEGLYRFTEWFVFGRYFTGDNSRI